MAIEVFNRYEKKYLLDEKKFNYLINRLGDYMRLDKYNQGQEFYNIANIYYDTASDELIARSIEKPEYKEKLRMRSYGVPGLEDKVFLEIKKKYDGLVNKRRTKIRLKDAYKLVEDGTLPPDEDFINHQVIREIEYLISKKDLIPKVYLTYDRKAYYDVDDFDFRVTFDTNIRTRREDVRLEAGNHGDLLIGNDKWLMEIKSSKAAPMWFVKLLSEEKIYPQSFSKYGTEYRKYMNDIYEKNNGEGDKKICHSSHYLTQKHLQQYQPTMQ